MNFWQNRFERSWPYVWLRVPSKVFLILTATALAACGDNFNINQILVTKEQRETVDILTAEAEINYDRGDFGAARSKAEKAYAINPKHEKTAVLLGYIYLSSAGIDAFQLAKSMIKVGDNQRAAALQSSSDTGDAAQTLSDLSSVIGISADDIIKLGTIPDSAVAAFQSYPVIHPADASIARSQSGVATLEYLGRAIQVICPFVDPAVLIEGDPRHARENCPESGKVSNELAKLHFLWAFAHLTDALAFREVLLYRSGEATTPHIQLRAEAVKTGATDVATYLNMVTELNADILAIFDPANADSQLNAVLNGLRAASAALSALPGIPDSLRAGITEAVSSIENAAPEGVANGAGDALKGQLTTEISGNLSTKIDELAASQPGEFAANQTEICALFDSISAAQVQNRPANCP